MRIEIPSFLPPSLPPRDEEKNHLFLRERDVHASSLSRGKFLRRNCILLPSFGNLCFHPSILHRTRKEHRSFGSRFALHHEATDSFSMTCREAASRRWNILTLCSIQMEEVSNASDI